MSWQYRSYLDIIGISDRGPTARILPLWEVIDKIDLAQFSDNEKRRSKLLESMATAPEVHSTWQGNHENLQELRGFATHSGPRSSKSLDDTTLTTIYDYPTKDNVRQDRPVTHTTHPMTPMRPITIFSLFSSTLRHSDSTMLSSYATLPICYAIFRFCARL